MLHHARNPVGADEVTAQVELVCANVGDVSFKPQQFDLIYSVGLFGLWVPINLPLLQRMSFWLKPDGVLAFTVIDANSPVCTTWKRRVINVVRPALPQIVRVWVDASPAHPLIRIREHELRQLINACDMEAEIKRIGDPNRRLDLRCIAHKHDSLRASCA
jgi:SAM-dependent methyltransferase